MNLFDIVRSAGGGEAFNTLARQYGLSEADMRKAVEAFLPAFSAGLKRSTADPPGLAAFMQLLAGAGVARAYAEPSFAFGGGRTEAEKALQLLFGSDEIARAVSSQASAFTGIAEAKLRELMAPLAALTLGGLAEQSKTANPWLEAMLQPFRAAAEAKPKTAKGPLDRLEEEQARHESQTSGAAELQRMQEEMIGAGMAAFRAGSAAWQKAMRENMSGAAPVAPAVSPEESAGAPSGSDLFGEMFEPGSKLNESYRREMEALFQRMRPADKRA